MGPAAVAWLSGLVGLLTGSFANVVIHRVPAGASVVSPPSACPGCDTPIRPLDNIPVLSWLVLRGRCRHCRAPISPRYPLVEVGTAVVLAAIGWRIGASWALPGFLALGWTMVVLSVIDLDTKRIPNVITIRAAPVVGVLLVVAALIEGQPWTAVRVLGGGAAAFAGMLVLALLARGGLGMGDVKLAGLLGLGLGHLSWAHVLLGIFGGFLIGGVVAIGLLVTGVRSRKDAVPFGPSLCAGALATILFGRGLIGWYLGTLGVA